MEKSLLKLLNDYGVERFLCAMEDICYGQAYKDHTENGDKWRSLATCICEILSEKRNIPRIVEVIK